MPHPNKYIHGYSKRETQRLREQSQILEPLMHGEISYPKGSIVLEPGCGVGAQTQLLLKHHPGMTLISMDMSYDSVQSASRHVCTTENDHTYFVNGNLLQCPFRAQSFDHIYLNFVLEHLAKPVQALKMFRSLLKPGGSITLNEGDHGSCFWYPETPAAKQTWEAAIKVQQKLGHDPLIGRRLHHLLSQAGFSHITTQPRYVSPDAGTPELLDGVVNSIIVPMTQAARNQAIEMGFIDTKTWKQGINELEQSGNPPEGSFFYTWFRGVGNA